MSTRIRRKCRHCGQLFRPHPGNIRRQRYCSAPVCRRASEAASQRRWLAKAANRDYFRGPEHVARESFFRARRFRDLDDLNDQADEWCSTRTAERPCRTCRSRGLRVCGRDWPVETVLDHPHLISPGQWMQDIRGGVTGADWDDSDWRNYGRLETVYAQPMAALMGAEDDVEAMRFWTGTPGWAGLSK